MAKRKAAPKHSLVAGDKGLTGYMKGSRLTDWHSKDLGWRTFSEDKSHYLSETDQKYYTVVLEKELKTMGRDGLFKKRYAAGVSMGDGMLFRGETSTSWDLEEAQEAANQIAEYWAEVDYEDALKDQEEQRQEFEEEHSG